MEMKFYRYVDGEKIVIQIKYRMFYLYDYYNGFTLEMGLDGVKHLVDVLKHIRYYSNDLGRVYLAQIIRTKLGYQKCWSNEFVIKRAKPVLDLLTDASSLEIDKYKLDKFNISNLKYIEARLPSGIKKVDGKILISLFSTD